MPRSMMQKIVGGRMEKPWAVAIGGHRFWVAVVVEVGEARTNKAKRTHMRPAGPPRERWIWATVDWENGARVSTHVSGRSGLAINGRPEVAQEIHRFSEIGIHLGRQVVRDAWRAIAALPREGGRKRTHRKTGGGAKLFRTARTRRPQKRCVSPPKTTRGEIGARPNAAREGGGMRCETTMRGREGPVIQGVLRCMWFAAPYAPPLVDAVAFRGRG